MLIAALRALVTCHHETACDGHRAALSFAFHHRHLQGVRMSRCLHALTPFSVSLLPFFSLCMTHCLFRIHSPEKSSVCSIWHDSPPFCITLLCVLAAISLHASLLVLRTSLLACHSVKSSCHSPLSAVACNLCSMRPVCILSSHLPSYASV